MQHHPHTYLYSLSDSRSSSTRLIWYSDFLQADNRTSSNTASTAIYSRGSAVMCVAHTSPEEKKHKNIYKPSDMTTPCLPPTPAPMNDLQTMDLEI